MNPSRYPRRTDPRTKTRYYEHRAVAEWKVGRPLEAGEVVHHDNGDKGDNHPENLWVCCSQSSHNVLHLYRRLEAGGAVPLFPLKELFALYGFRILR